MGQREVETERWTRLCVWRDREREGGREEGLCKRKRGRRKSQPQEYGRNPNFHEISSLVVISNFKRRKETSLQGL